MLSGISINMLSGYLCFCETCDLVLYLSLDFTCTLTTLALLCFLELTWWKHVEHQHVSVVPAGIFTLPLTLVFKLVPTGDLKTIRSAQEMLQSS